MDANGVLTFEELINPALPTDFFHQFWEQKRLHVPRSSPGFFDSLFSIDDLESWVQSAAGEAQSIVLVPPEGSAGTGAQLRPRDVSLDQLYAAFARGQSLVLNGLERSWSPLFPLLEDLGRLFCAEIGVNAYLTPKGSQTFHVHLDLHDVFVLQIYGRKAWRLYEFEHLPIRHLDFKRDLNFPAYWSRPEKATLSEELDLCEGDVLYIPRGMPHCAVAKESASLHLTVAVNSFYWLDLMKAALEQACFGVPLLRETLPPRLGSDRQVEDDMRERFRSLAETVSRQVSFDDAIRVMKRRIVRRQGFPTTAHFRQLLNMDNVTSASLVERRAGFLCMVEIHKDAGEADIRFGTAIIRGPRSALQKAFEYIATQDRFVVASIPGLDDQGKLVLVKRLIRQGLLRRVECEKSCEP